MVPTRVRNKHCAERERDYAAADQQPFVGDVPAQMNAGKHFKYPDDQSGNGDQLDHMYQRQARE